MLLLDFHLLVHLLRIHRRLSISGRLRFLIRWGLSNASARIQEIIELGLAVFHICAFSCVGIWVLVSLVLATSGVVKKLHLVAHVNEDIFGSLRIWTCTLHSSLRAWPNAGNNTCAARRHLQWSLHYLRLCGRSINLNLRILAELLKGFDEIIQISHIFLDLFRVVLLVRWHRLCVS